jgi:hypothetical protein
MMLTAGFRIELLDNSASVIRELFADARSAVGAVELARDIDWPPRAVTMRVLNLDCARFIPRGSGATGEPSRISISGAAPL